MANTPANDNAIVGHAQPLTISSANCLALTGMSWSWVTRFARAHGVPVWRVGSRKQLIPGAQLAAAMEAANAEQRGALTEDDVCEQAKRKYAAKWANRA